MNILVFLYSYYKYNNSQTIIYNGTIIFKIQKLPISYEFKMFLQIKVKILADARIKIQFALQSLTLTKVTNIYKKITIRTKNKIKDSFEVVNMKPQNLRMDWRCFKKLKFIASLSFMIWFQNLFRISLLTNTKSPGNRPIPTSTEANGPDQYMNIQAVRIHTQTLS